MTADVATATQMTKNELYGRYCNLRSRGLTPVQILSDYSTELHAPVFSVSGLVSVVIGIIAFVVVDNIIGGKCGRSQEVDGDLWIESPSGKTVRLLPFWTAVRIIRKQGWVLADVEPVHDPPTPLTRWEHLRLALGWRMSK